jgi:hypothetical protein
MASGDAITWPKKNTAFRVTFPILDADGDLVSGATTDSERSIDGGTFADCSNEATEIATSSGMYYLDLNASEMNGDCISLIIKDSGTGKTTPIVMYPAQGDLDDIYSDTTIIHSDTIVISSDTTAIHTQTTAIESEMIVVHSETTHLQSDTAAIEIDTGNIYSDTTIIYSDTSLIHSETTAIQIDTGNIYSDTAIIYSDTTIIHSDTIVISSDTTAIHTQTTAIESELIVTHSETTDVQARLPAALSSGNIKADVLAISTSTAAADNLEASAEVIITAAAAAGTLSTTQMTTDLTEATDDHYNGRIVIWTSGALLGQATDITDYTGATKLVTYTAVTEAPGAGDTFVIV